MTNMNWRLLVHSTDGEHVTYTLSSYEWRGAARRGGGFLVMSTCLAEELPAVLDQCADLILHDGEFQLQLPL